MYDTGVLAEYGDKLISLSTCEYSRNNGRLVVVAKSCLLYTSVTKDIASIAIWDIDPATLPEKEMEETNWELLSDEEMEALFINNQTN